MAAWRLNAPVTRATSLQRHGSRRNAQYPMARSRLTSVLAVEPGNVDARLLLAELEPKQGQYQSSLRQFERVLERRPGNLEALLGEAQTRYYTGDLAKLRSRPATS